MPLHDWFDQRIHRLLYDSLAYQICLPIFSLLYLCVYVVKISKEQAQKPTLQPHQTTTIFVTALLMCLTFVSVGLWVLQKQFYIFFLLQIAQLIVYILLSFSIITFAKTPRIFCIKFEPATPCAVLTVRFVTAVSHGVLGVSTILPLSLSALIIDSKYVTDNTNQDFQNMLDTTAGGCFYLFLCHCSGALCELLMGVFGIFSASSARKGKRHTKYVENGVEKEVSYDLSDEAI